MGLLYLYLFYLINWFVCLFVGWFAVPCLLASFLAVLSVTWSVISLAGWLAVWLAGLIFKAEEAKQSIVASCFVY